MLITELYLAKNELTTIHEATFANLPKLTVLDLSYNRLSHFNVDIPDSVEALLLKFNPLFSGDMFQQRSIPCVFIKYLSLAGTNVTQPSIFSGYLPTLRYLDLRDIPNLSLTATDLRKLRHLLTLDISSNLFDEPARSYDCAEVVETARQFKIEVKGVSCSSASTLSLDYSHIETAM